MIPKSILKRIAAYYTSNTACELLARLTINRGDETVLDPACGSGGFLIAAYKVKDELSGSEHNHKKLIESLYGFDVSTFASHLSVINLTLQDLRNATDEVYVTVEDAFNQHTDKTIELLESIPADSQVATVQGITSKTKVLPSFDIILMNPPFTRIERLEESYKNYLIGPTGIFREFTKYFKGQSGLHCFFLVHIKLFLKDGGLFGTVLPAATFSSEYGTKLKPFILNNYRIEYLFAYEKQSTFSVDCDFKEILLVGVKGTKEAWSTWKAKVIVLKEELEINKIEAYVNQFRLIERDVDSESYSVRIVTKEEFRSERNWMTFTRPIFLKEFIKKLRNSKAISNQEEVIQFHEGYHADAPYFFRLPNDYYWSIENDGDLFATISEKVTGRKLNISKRYLVKVFDLPDAHRTIAAAMNSYIFSIPESEPENNIAPDVRKYIEWGNNIKKSADSKKIPDFYKILKYTSTGRRWYTYGNYTLYREDQLKGGKTLIGGRIALVEKFRTKTRECIVLYSPNQLVGSYSYFFGIMNPVRNLSPEEEEVPDSELILGAWFSSTIFLALYMYYRREISGDYGRIRIGDMEAFPCSYSLQISTWVKMKLFVL